jgi:hypothetical protein
MSATTEKLGRRPRDRRLDFFRGVAMFIILIAHIPYDWWALWIPARFGFSDGAEMFVFCSGMASALAFGSLFRTHGLFIVVARVAHRIWQIYWAHIGLFFSTVLVLLIGNTLDTGVVYTDRLHVIPFLEDPETHLVGLLTLTYVPGLFDMLPMYVVVLALLPVVATLGNIRPLFAGLFVALLWLAATTNHIDLPAKPGEDLVWFFNPFGWQLVFYTGFAFATGWLKAPPIRGTYVAIAVAIVLVSVPLSYHRLYFAVPALLEAREALAPFWNKTDYGILRYIHFLALAYLAYAAVGEGGRRLFATGLPGRVIDMFRLVGQQSLAVFIVSIVFGQVLGIVLDIVERSHWSMIYIHVIGFGGLVLTAKVVTWFKSEPWRKVPSRQPHAEARRAPGAAAREPAE